MAGEKVISGNLRLTLDDGSIFHATECSLTMTRELKERSTKDTDGIERSKGIKSWSASASALAVYGSDGTGTNDFAALFNLYNDDTDTLVAVEFVQDETDAVYKFVGSAIIESLEMNAANEEDATASISLSGSGAMAMEELNPA
ncbi:MAG TPA: phage tail tube protein [Salinimicrobium sp.]|nr:phage tail tube protein [Salinimicrobium sp.]